MSFSITYRYAALLNFQLLKNTAQCPYCLLHGAEPITPHAIISCPTLIDGSGQYNVDTFLAWRRGIIYNSQHHPGICFLCHVPQGPNNALHSTFTGRWEDCLFPDIIAPLAYGVLTQSDLAASAQRQFPIADFSTPMASLEWINQAPMGGHPSNLIALFAWFSATFIWL